MSTNRAILCVDDERIIVLSIKNELKNHFKDRFVYEMAYTAEEAIEIIAELCDEGIRVILVISDWLMPGMKGDEFLAIVKQRHQGIKTILLTGNADKATIDSLQREGITNDVIYKPWNTVDLIRRVERCVAEHED
jgi:CheY-like chemotaxis protein